MQETMRAATDVTGLVLPGVGHFVPEEPVARSMYVSPLRSVANAAYIREDPVAVLLSNHESIALVHISDTTLDSWGQV
ncbi:hypothetical protein [Pseudonocardia sp. GCM10023141]|uniref:hypothetical protein n=1 Tax=Pseudonocardia sp. GCM10023141 TaxID=3252653 RepID=UPI00361112F6